MDTYQATWGSCITPILILYSIWSIRRGWNILKHNQMSLDFPFVVNSFVIRIFRGEEKSWDYEDSVLADTEKMKETALYSLIGGIVTLIVCGSWIFLLFKQN